MKGFIKLSVLLLVALSSLLIGCGSGSSSSNPDPAEKVYTITFDPNGGSGGPAAVDATYGKPMPQLSAAAAPTPPTGSGSYFAGYYDADGTMYYTRKLDPAKEYWDKTSNTTLYARWTQTEEAVIIYYKNDGGSETKTQTVDLNASVNLDANTFTRNGYTFSGWATSVTGAVEYADGANYTASLTSIGLYAVWSANEPGKVVITFHKNDGTNATTTQTVSENTTIALTANTFTRGEGYTFSGWATSVTGAVEYADGANYTVTTTGVNLYAVWTSTSTSATIVFHSNFGSDETKTQTVEQSVSTALDTNTFTRTAEYTFLGWSLSSTATSATYLDGANYTATESSVNLYAVWTSASTSATIVFHSNFGSDETKTQTVEQNVPTALDANTFTRTAEYTFLGWSLSSTATSATYLDGANYTATESSVNLYAVWTSVPLRAITFHKNDGSGENVIQQVPENTISNLAMNTFTRDLYVFIGWSDTPSGSVLYVDGAEYPMGNSNVNFYAVWANKRIITFHGNGGSIPITGDVTKTQEAPEDRAIALAANTFAKTFKGEESYFVGWSLTPTGTVEYANGANYTAGTENVDLYARWSVNSYTITFDANEGTGGPTTVEEAVYGSPMPDLIGQTPPTRAGGYVFLGYTDSPTGGGIYYTANLTSARDWDMTSDTNITLYARWVMEIKDIVVGMNMIWIPAGTFWMGSSDGSGTPGNPYPAEGRTNEQPRHEVTLTAGFYMGKYEVTQDEYFAVMGSNPSSFSSSPYGVEIQGKRPVEQVSWYDALVFCNKLSEKEGLSPAYRINSSTDPAAWGTVPTSSNATWDAVSIVSGSTGYRLPTESQWEYACRAGTTTVYNTGATIDDTAGWYSSNSNNMTHQVGLKAVNAFGLYDMHGNVYEWCYNWYTSGSVRVLRGGSWYGDASNMRSAYRLNDGPYSRYFNIGFRVVRP